MSTTPYLHPSVLPLKGGINFRDLGGKNSLMVEKLSLESCSVLVR